MINVTCEFCGRSLDPLDPGTYRRVSGWVQIRKAGGIHHIKRPQETGRFACKVCVEYGGQPSMFTRKD
jgi:hypothetical protein